jgi:hypothetical protein
MRPSDGALPSVLSGVVQKGPFVFGSSISVQELDANLAPSGQAFNVSTRDDEGDFVAAINVRSRYVEVTASGNYFDERTNQLSTTPLTLRALADLTSSATVNVNLLTSMSDPLIRNLVGQSVSFSQAQTQAESSVLSALGLPGPLGAPFSNVGLTGSARASAELLAASLIVQQYAASLGSEVAQLTQLLSGLGTATTDAGLGNATLNVLNASLCATIWSIPVTSVRANLTGYYTSLGVPTTIPPFEQFLCGCGIMCGTTCVKAQTDPNNCGSCGTVCATGAICQSGSCTCSTLGDQPCSGVCVNEQTDTNNCGACGNRCSATGQSCQAGTCACPSGETVCSGACVNELTDPNNCGACGNKCTVTGQSCQSGTCACPSGETVCSGACVNEKTDANNCSACGNKCGAGQSCQSGTCSSALVRYGYTAPFSGGTSFNSSFGANYLLGIQVNVPSTMTLTALGIVIATAGNHMTLALYTNTGTGGAPGTLLASTASVTAAAGANEIPVGNITLAPGTYWIMGEYDSPGPYISDDNCGCNMIDYTSVTYPSVPSTFPAPTTYTGGHFPYYVVGH